ncbi:MAG: hypothetical protein U1E41_15825 [Paracoccus sp. (in: a-proteobacteria)]
MIDTTFLVTSDARGRDPDSHSPTLRRFHRTLWSKPLPNGKRFDLSLDVPGQYLHHRSELGEFSLSSDSIGHSYRYIKATAPIIEQVPVNDLDSFYELVLTIGAYIVFPARKVDGKATINGARGMHAKIRDRFDLTLECIRRHYAGEASPLSEVLTRYANFFSLFGSFEGYADFFLLQDLTTSNGSAVRFTLPFDGFESKPLPADVPAYLAYRESMMAFVEGRNNRILAQTRSDEPAPLQD